MHSVPQISVERTPAFAGEWIRRPDHRVVEYWTFLRAFLRSPGRVGSVVPSSRVLGEAIVDGVDLQNARMVVELGPGTGVFTQMIAERTGPDTRFLAIELDPQAVRRLDGRVSGATIYHDSAENVRHYVERHGCKHADVVISSLPWSLMPPEVQARIMRNVAAVLKPDGVFATICYLGTTLTSGGRIYARLLRELFGTVHWNQRVWRNLPPAFVYRCTAPRRNPERNGKRRR